jgi:hypothetical protein
MNMKLLTQEIVDTLPLFYSQDGLGEEAMVHVKFFDPMSNWTWYVIEYCSNIQEFFGLVKGFETEYGYFRLKDLQSVGRIERDLHFTPKKVKELGFFTTSES